MLGQVLRYGFRHPARAVSALVSSPARVLEKVHDRAVQEREYQRPAMVHRPLQDWERRLHIATQTVWPCEASVEFQNVWPCIVGRVRAAGIDVGPGSFAGYNDGDAGLARALWCLVRHRKPRVVVETGVGHGITSRCILEAMALNGSGHLYSIDLPPLDPATRKRVGVAVEPRLAGRWTLIADSSRRALPELVSRVGAIDLFVHDSLHTERNVCFEADLAWNALRDGGAMVIDDIDSNRGYQTFTESHTGFHAMVCEAEPVRPDERRFNRKGLFAIVLKDPAAA
ncbi:MAG TPA: class I SAM-dependent methyltransferase [Rhizomicrobium sp.]|nr:class I SAM-dependent methyltransferase [Rhizomicrobium sp.]